MVFFWIVLYELICIIAKKLPCLWAGSLLMLVFVAVFLLWIRRTGRTGSLWLGRAQDWCIRDLFLLLPLLVLPAYNLLTVAGHDWRMASLAYMFAVCAVEEVFFRGFLLRFLTGFGKRNGILLSAAVFALLHLMNLWQNESPAYVLSQWVCAFAAGFCYGALTLRYQSLFPSFALHFLTNLTGMGEIVYPQTPLGIWGLWVCIGVYMLYGRLVCRVWQLR